MKTATVTTMPRMAKKITPKDAQLFNLDMTTDLLRVLVECSDYSENDLGQQGELDRILAKEIVSSFPKSASRWSTAIPACLMPTLFDRLYLMAVSVGELRPEETNAVMVALAAIGKNFCKLGIL